MRKIIVKTLMLVSLSGVLSATYVGCGYEAEFEKIARETAGECEPEKDKGDCTEVYQCEDEVAIVYMLKNGEDCETNGNAGTCNADGKCEASCLFDQSCPCHTKDDCPTDDCHVVECESSGQCSIPKDQANGIPCNLLSKEGICDFGTCVECTNDNHCSNMPADQAPWRCHMKQCVSCLNDIHDTNEEGIDCGGDCDAKCNAKSCSSPNACKSGNCIDGVCCNTKCSDKCYACNLNGFEGVCTGVPAGEHDDCNGDGNPNTKSGCNTDNMCQTTGGNGQVCSMDQQCLSGICKLAPFQLIAYCSKP